MHLVGVRGVDPGHLEHVFDLFSEADASPAIGRDVNAGDALRPSQLGGLEEQLVLLRAERADHVRYVIADNNDVSPLWVLWSLHFHPERDNSHLMTHCDSSYQLHISAGGRKTSLVDRLKSRLTLLSPGRRFICTSRPWDSGTSSVHIRTSLGCFSSRPHSLNSACGRKKKQRRSDIFCSRERR